MFISFEGPDGSGKTLQAAQLHDFLVQSGYRVLLTREPGGTQIGEQVRQILFDLKNTAMTPRTETLLFMAARTQLVEEVIRPHLAQGYIVVSDRFSDSTLAYQGYGHQNDLTQIENLVLFATGGLKPDLTFLLDIDVEVGLERRTKGGKWNRLDAYDLEFHRRTRWGYQQLASADPRRWVIIDASQPPGQVQAIVRQAVLTRLAMPHQREGSL